MTNPFLVAYRRSRKETMVNRGLSPREREIHALMVEGYNNVEIARRLGISYSTVSTHTRHMAIRLNVSTRQLREVKL